MDRQRAMGKGGKVGQAKWVKLDRQRGTAKF